MMRSKRGLMAPSYMCCIPGQQGRAYPYVMSMAPCAAVIQTGKMKKCGDLDGQATAACGCWCKRLDVDKGQKLAWFGQNLAGLVSMWQ